MYKLFYKYYIYDDGRVYSLKTQKFLKPDYTSGYYQVTLFTNGLSKRYKVHRLVAFCFCNPPDNYQELVVNHKDGNKTNNHYTNLEWCTQYYNNYHARVNGLNNVSLSNSIRWNDDEFREQTSKNIAKSAIESKCHAREKNGRFRYRIYDKNGVPTNITDIGSLFGLKYPGVYRIVRIFLNTGRLDKRFIEAGITIEDLQSKVNRLSNDDSSHQVE